MNIWDEAMMPSESKLTVSLDLVTFYLNCRKCKKLKNNYLCSLVLWDKNGAETFAHPKWSERWAFNQSSSTETFPKRIHTQDLKHLLWWILPENALLSSWWKWYVWFRLGILQAADVGSDESHQICEEDASLKTLQASAQCSLRR